MWCTWRGKLKDLSVSTFDTFSLNCWTGKKLNQKKNNLSNILISSTDLTPSYWRGTMVILLVDAELERGKGKETGCFGKRRLYWRIKGEEKVFAKNVKGKMVVWAKKNLHEWITEKEYVSLLNFIKRMIKRHYSETLNSGSTINNQHAQIIFLTSTQIQHHNST